MEIIVRTAIPGDAEAIAGLTSQLGYSLSVPDTTNNLNALLLNDNDLIVVAETEKKVVGWMHVSGVVCLESNPFGEIKGLVVDLSQHRKGIGRLLVDNAKKWCLKKGLQRLRVRSQIKRKEAHTFYEDLGFSEIKVQKVFDMHF